MAKEPIRVVPSDDCRIIVDGVESHPHVGESVTFRGWFDTTGLSLMWDLAELFGRIAASEDEEAARLIDTSDPLLLKFLDALAPLIHSWTWTNDLGKPLPQPHLNAAALKALTLDELIYLALLAVPRPLEEKKENDGCRHSQI